MKEKLIFTRRDNSKYNFPYILVNKELTTLFFEIKHSVKKLKDDNDDVIVTFGIRNSNFATILTEDFFKKKELIYLFNLLKSINKNKLIEEKVSFINPKLRFNFWFCDEHQYLNIIFMFHEIYEDSYTLSLNPEDVEKLYYLLRIQLER